TPPRTTLPFTRALRCAAQRTPLRCRHGRRSDRRSERLPSRVLRGRAQVLGDAQELVVLGHAVGATRAAGLDLPCSRGDGKVGDECVFGLAGAVTDDRVEAVAASELDRLEGLGQRADLVDLDQDRVARTLFDATPQVLRIRDEQVVADEL